MKVCISDRTKRSYIRIRCISNRTEVVLAIAQNVLVVEQKIKQNILSNKKVVLLIEQKV